MGVPILTRSRAEIYVPDVDTNRKDAQAGQPALFVMLNRPTVAQWQEYNLARILKLRTYPQVDDKMATILTRADDRETESLLMTAAIGAIWIGDRRPDGSVAEIGKLTVEDGSTIESGTDLWARQDELDFEYASSLIADLRSAVFDRASFTEGTLAALDSRSGSSVSPTQTDGIAETAAVAD